MKFLTSEAFSLAAGVNDRWFMSCDFVVECTLPVRSFMYFVKFCESYFLKLLKLKANAGSPLIDWVISYEESRS